MFDTCIHALVKGWSVCVTSKLVRWSGNIWLSDGVTSLTIFDDKYASGADLYPLSIALYTYQA